MNIVLYQPQIPANTGSVARLCAVTGCSLHLIRPLGFFLADRHMKRAGLDYWQYVDVRVHDSWLDFAAAVDPKHHLYFVETGGQRGYHEVSYQTQDYLVFGSETTGIPQTILDDCSQNHLTVPMLQGRSLNLANTAAIVVYEAWRQHNFTW